MSVGRLRNMAPYWLDETVKYISNPESAPGIREDLMFLRTPEARPEPAKT